MMGGGTGGREEREKRSGVPTVRRAMFGRGRILFEGKISCRGEGLRRKLKAVRFNADNDNQMYFYLNHYSSHYDH